MREARIPESEQNWSGVSDALVTIEHEANARNLTYLFGAARRARIAVEGEFRKNLAAAEHLASEVTATWSSETRQELGFLVLECLGRQYLYLGDHSRAVEALRNALTRSAFSCAITQLYAQLALARALCEQGSTEAIEAIDHAVTFAKSRPEIGGIPKLELVKVLGEGTIISAWIHGPRIAYDRLDATARALFAARTSTKEWNDVAVLVSHTSAFLYKGANQGHTTVIPTTNDGLQEANLNPGLYSTTHNTRHELWSPQREFILVGSMAAFADILAKDEQVDFWTHEAQHLSRSKNASGLGYLIDTFGVLGAIAAGDRDKAVLRALESRDSKPMSLIVTLGVSISSANIGIDNRDSARANLLYWAEQIRTRVSDAGEGWQHASAILQFGAESEPSLEAFTDRSNREPELMTRCALALMAIARSEDLRLSSALGAHIVVAKFLSDGGQFALYLQRRLLLPYLARYWTAAVDRAAFRFRTPALLKQSIEQANRVPAHLRSQAILREVGWSLGLPMPEDVKEWLSRRL
jgi:hypothetical protein